MEDFNTVWKHILHYGNINYVNGSYIYKTKNRSVSFPTEKEAQKYKDFYSFTSPNNYYTKKEDNSGYLVKSQNGAIYEMSFQKFEAYKQRLFTDYMCEEPLEETEKLLSCPEFNKKFRYTNTFIDGKPVSIDNFL